MSAKPLLLIAQKAGATDEQLQMLRDAGYCVLVVNKHSDVKVLDGVAGHADELLLAALEAIRANSGFGNAKEDFAERLLNAVIAKMVTPVGAA